MARKEIKGPITDETLNSTNHNFKELYDGFGNVVKTVSDKAFDKVVDSARLNWATMVEKYSDLPSDAETGTTIGVKEDSLVYRYDGSKWVDIYEINLNPISEVDDRLSSQLADADNIRHFESMISRKKPKKPLFSIVDDDSNRGFYTKLFKLAKEYGIPITSAMITGAAMGFPGDDRPYNNRYYNYKEVMEMHESGLVEFVPHTHDHLNLTDASDSEIREDFKKTISFMKKHGFNHRGIVYPFGNYNNRVINIAKEFFDYSTGSGGKIDEGKRIITAPVNNYRLGRFRTDQDLQTIKNKIDETFDVNGALIFISHADQDSINDKQHYRDIVEYILNKGGEFAKLDDIVKMHGNIAQFGGTSMNPTTTISSDGKVVSNELGTLVFDKSTSIKIDTPLDYFKVDSITVSVIRQSQLEGFPLDDVGLLTTYRISAEDKWNRQIVQPIKSMNQYVRYWENGWTKFVPVTGFDLIEQLNPYNSENTIDDFPVGTTVFRTSTTRGGNQLPNGKGGTFKVIKVSQNEAEWNYQDFKEHGSNNRYTRYAKTKTSWSDWFKFVLE